MPPCAAAPGGELAHLARLVQSGKRASARWPVADVQPAHWQCDLFHLGAWQVTAGAGLAPCPPFEMKRSARRATFGPTRSRSAPKPAGRSSASWSAALGSTPPRPSRCRCPPARRPAPITRHLGRGRGAHQLMSDTMSGIARRSGLPHAGTRHVGAHRCSSSSGGGATARAGSGCRPRSAVGGVARPSPPRRHGARSSDRPAAVPADQRVAAPRRCRGGVGVPPEIDRAVEGLRVLETQAANPISSASTQTRPPSTQAVNFAAPRRGCRPTPAVEPVVQS